MLIHQAEEGESQALATATFHLTRVWEKKVLDKDVVSTTYTLFQKDHKMVLDEIRDHMQNNTTKGGKRWQERQRGSSSD
ncbi:hypothetical protein WJX77_004762 [Trebouxia sp. C0004]